MWLGTWVALRKMPLENRFGQAEEEKSYEGISFYCVFSNSSPAQLQRLVGQGRTLSLWKLGRRGPTVKFTAASRSTLKVTNQQSQP